MRYDHTEIELRWQKIWDSKNVFQAKVDHTKPKFYCLEMFPYPSGNMHMGHVRNYSIGDAMARFQRMMGKNVLYPMGYDSFGMPAENAAKKEQGHPEDVTTRNISSIKSDQRRMGYSYDWGRQFATSDVGYYKWNQSMFLDFHDKGLVERRSAPVNWCVDCDTVLANEQVKNNRCWRCGLEVVQRDMSQWFLRMTEYSDELLESLDEIVFPENVKAMQRNWIGRSRGAEIRFPIEDSDEEIACFTTRPDTIFGVTFLTLSPEHKLCPILCGGSDWEHGWIALRDECAKLSEFERINLLKEKKGVFLGRYALNPMSGERIPIYAGNFVVAGYGTGAVMAVPGHDERDFEFAKKYGLEIRTVLQNDSDQCEDVEPKSAFTGYGSMIGSSKPGLDGLVGEEAKSAVISLLEREGSGVGTTQYRLRDWLLSRQRFWGTPIPMIHCESCGTVPVPREDLPVTLPLDLTFTEDQGGNPLASHEKFCKVKCPECGNEARRETDTMDTFYDSSWYFMRFCDADNSELPFSRKSVDYWMGGGVDLYIGGIEHAVMHLLYARFFTKATRDMGMNSVGEPFGRLVCQGMLNAPAPYCSSCNAEYHVDFESQPCPSCGDILGTRSAKMSKSLGNTVSPGEMVEKYGADTVRLFILFGANPEAGMEWSDTAIDSNHRHLVSIIVAFEASLSMKESEGGIDEWLLAKGRSNMDRWIASMENVSLREGVMISHFEMLSDWQWYIRRGGGDRDSALNYMSMWAQMIAPVTPHIAEELWMKIGGHDMLSKKELNPTGANSNDKILLAEENYLKSVIDTSRNLLTLAQKHSDSPLQNMVIQTAASWAQELACEAVSLSRQDFNFHEHGMDHIKSHTAFTSSENKGQVMQMWSTITRGSKKKRGKIQTWTDEEKALVSIPDKEIHILENNRQFIATSLGINQVEVYEAGSGEDVGGKAGFALPLEPGLAFV
ncbi:MAG: leucine--tRNA ligase [Candidatus Thermoplasmatota archaeon]|nr:leucine--tRNA ligase [Candidatus Thermoplasmatota archaeon]